MNNGVGYIKEYFELKNVYRKFLTQNEQKTFISEESSFRYSDLLVNHHTVIILGVLVISSH